MNGFSNCERNWRRLNWVNEHMVKQIRLSDGQRRSLFKPTKECPERLRIENIHTAFYGWFDSWGKFRGTLLHPAKILMTSRKLGVLRNSLCTGICFSCFSTLVDTNKILLPNRHRNENCKEEHAAKWWEIAQKSSLLYLLCNERDKVNRHGKRTKS